jgi:hypothetical protein
MPYFTHVTGGEGGEHSEKLAPIAVRARHLLAVNLGTARATELLKLGVERLPVGADAGHSPRRRFSGEVSVIPYGKCNPLIGLAQRNFPKVLINAQTVLNGVPLAPAIGTPVMRRHRPFVEGMHSAGRRPAAAADCLRRAGSVTFASRPLRVGQGASQMVTSVKVV